MYVCIYLPTYLPTCLPPAYYLSPIGSVSLENSILAPKRTPVISIKFCWLKQLQVPSYPQTQIQGEWK